MIDIGSTVYIPESLGELLTILPHYKLEVVAYLVHYTSLYGGLRVDAGNSFVEAIEVVDTRNEDILYASSLFNICMVRETIRTNSCSIVLLGYL